MLPRPLLLATLLLCACGGGGEARSRGPARRVVLITCDTLRADRLGVYGYERPTSPCLDAFAREAVVFEEAYATAPMTVPAVSSILTGRYPIEIGTTFDNHLLMPPEARTLPEVLAEHGIPSGAVVSNFVLRKPTAEGTRGASVAQGFLSFDDTMESAEQNRMTQFERLAPDTTAAAIAWLDGHREADSFFFWVHYQDPHGPYTPPPADERAFARPREGGLALETTGDRYGRGGIPRYQLLGDERDPEVYRDLYDAEIHAFDRSLGELLAWLGTEGFLEDTLVIFTADHGESLGEHGYWFCHGENTHREVVRVPLVVRYLEGMQRPFTVERDGYARCASVASHLDLWSTVLEAFGIEPPPSRGTSLLGQLPDRRYPAQFLYPEEGQPKWWSVGDGSRRVVWSEDAGFRLFDVRSDPYEEHDLYPERRPEAEAMSAELMRVLKDVRGKPLLQGVQLRVDEETRAALEALGYASSAAER